MLLEVIDQVFSSSLCPMVGTNKDKRVYQMGVYGKVHCNHKSYDIQI